MNDTDFKKLLLKTSFCCMAADGHIDSTEIEVINNLCLESHLFEDINYKSELSEQAELLNKQGKNFVTDFLLELENTELSERQKLNVVDFAFKTIEADNEVHYSEIKFFKVIRAKLKISKELISENYQGKEDYLEDDIITDTHLHNMLDTSFTNLGDLNIVIE